MPCESRHRGGLFALWLLGGGTVRHEAAKGEGVRHEAAKGEGGRHEAAKGEGVRHKASRGGDCSSLLSTKSPSFSAATPLNINPRVQTGQSGRGPRLMKHGIPCCWLVLK